MDEMMDELGRGEGPRRIRAVVGSFPIKWQLGEIRLEMSGIGMHSVIYADAVPAICARPWITA